MRRFIRAKLVSFFPPLPSTIVPASLRRISSFARLDAFLFSFFFSFLFFRGIIKDKKGYSFYDLVDASLWKIINLLNWFLPEELDDILIWWLGGYSLILMSLIIDASIDRRCNKSIGEGWLKKENFIFSLGFLRGWRCWVEGFWRCWRRKMLCV